MRKHVSILLGVMLGLTSYATAGSVTLDLSDIATERETFGPPKGAGFAAFKDWLDNADYEDKYLYFHSLNDTFIERHGEKSNELRLCINLQKNNDNGRYNWVDKRWI